MSLSFYLQDLQAILQDYNFAFNTRTQSIRWINQARTDCARITGCIQRLVSGSSAFGAGAQPGYMLPGGIQPGALPGSSPATDNPLASQFVTQNSMQTITGLERYPYQGFFNPILQRQHEGCQGVIDVIQVAVNWGGNFRPGLVWMPWDDLQAWCRSYADQTTAYPAVWSTFNDGERGELWLFPVPSQPNEIEIYAACVPKYIYSDSDFDAIPEEMRNSIKFKAAHLSFFASQRYAQAEAMQQEYLSSLGNSVVARDRGKVQSYYSKVI